MTIRQERTMYQRILLPVDLVDPNLARPAVDTAVMLAKACGGVIRVVNVLQMTPVMLAEYVPPDFDIQQRKVAEDALDVIVEDLRATIPGTSAVVRQGGVHQEILDEAKEIGADLIVMSSHRVGVRSYFLGSVAGHVVRYATCSVMVVRR
jgi:nucleotide-binding universal stress UspA family protein